jgi:hypothetical protein
MLLAAIDGDAAGLGVRLEGGELRFTHRSLSLRVRPS